MPYRRCPRCGLSSYVPRSHNHPAICPHCERPLPSPDAEDGSGRSADVGGRASDD